MAVMQGNYTRVISYSGNKNLISISKEESSGELSKVEVIGLSEGDVIVIADKVTELIYNQLKIMGYLVGDDC